MSFIIIAAIIVGLTRLLFSCIIDPCLSISSYQDGFNFEVNNDEPYFYKPEWGSQFVMQINENYRLNLTGIDFPLYMICSDGSITEFFSNDILKSGCEIEHRGSSDLSPVSPE